MMINRHNYEEFFLLYADDELNSQQRTAVELFVQQNPDMAAELDMLLQMKLQPDEHIVFPDKSSLFKTADVEININNYEEFFLLYVDRELDKTARGKVEKFVLQHPQVQDEFTLLKQTILQPEAITFGDKSSLYKKEEKRLPYIGFVRMAVAAAVIGIAVLGWWLYPTGKTVNSVGGQFVQNTKTKTPVTTLVTKDSVTTIIPAPQIKQDNTVAANPARVQKQVKAIQQPLQQVTNQVQQALVQQPVNNDNIAYQPNQQPVEVINTPVNVNTNPVIAGNIEPTDLQGDNLVTISNPVIKHDAGEVKQGQHDEIAVLNAQPNVPYKVIDTNDEDRSMYIGSLELNKDKVRGFLKKAGRIFGGKGKKDVN